MSDMEEPIGAQERYIAVLQGALAHIAKVANASRTQTKRMQFIRARALSAINGDDSWITVDRPTMRQPKEQRSDGDDE